MTGAKLAGVRSMPFVTGHAVGTIRRHAGDILVRAPRREPDLVRWGRLLRAVETAGYGERAAIARRFGYANTNSMSVALAMAKRRIAQSGSRLPTPEAEHAR